MIEKPDELFIRLERQRALRALNVELAILLLIAGVVALVTQHVLGSLKVDRSWLLNWMPLSVLVSLLLGPGHTYLERRHPSWWIHRYVVHANLLWVALVLGAVLHVTPHVLPMFIVAIRALPVQSTTLLLITLGGALYVFRWYLRSVYGATEALVGVIVGTGRFADDIKGASTLTWNLTLGLITAGAFLIVRGLDNIHQGATKEPKDRLVSLLVEQRARSKARRSVTSARARR